MTPKAAPVQCRATRQKTAQKHRAVLVMPLQGYISPPCVPSHKPPAAASTQGAMTALIKSLAFNVSAVVSVCAAQANRSLRWIAA